MIKPKWCWALAVVCCLLIQPLWSSLLAQDPPGVAAPAVSALRRCERGALPSVQDEY